MYRSVADCTFTVLNNSVIIVMVKLPPVGTSGNVVNKVTLSSLNHCTYMCVMTMCVCVYVVVCDITELRYLHTNHLHQ